jgi:hypothetical protein
VTWIESVRRRPQLYFVPRDGIVVRPLHLLVEVLSDALYEASSTRGVRIVVEVRADSARVVDDGRGIPATPLNGVPRPLALTAMLLVPPPPERGQRLAPVTPFCGRFSLRTVTTDATQSLVLANGNVVAGPLIEYHEPRLPAQPVPQAPRSSSGLTRAISLSRSGLRRSPHSSPSSWVRLDTWGGGDPSSSTRWNTATSDPESARRFGSLGVGANANVVSVLRTPIAIRSRCT